MDSEEAERNIAAVPRGAAGMGIGERYPVDRYGGLEVMTTATVEDLREVGFNPAEILDPEGGLFVYCGLRIDGELVAMWDEGRWWTPQESDAFLAVMQHPVVRMLAETTHAIETQNREQRRKKRPR